MRPKLIIIEIKAVAIFSNTRNKEEKRRFVKSKKSKEKKSSNKKIKISAKLKIVLIYKNIDYKEI